MNNFIRPIMLGTLPVALASFLLTGCQESSAPKIQPTIDPSIHVQTSTIPDSIPPAIAIATPSAEPITKSEDTTKHEAQVAGTTKTDLADLPQISSSASSKPTAKPNIKAEDAYQQEKPTLMGLKLGMSKNVVLDRFGKAKKQFVMEEDHIQVYDFTDFSVGFNTKDALEFVDVHSTDIDPGLRGLRLGQKVQDVINTLGKPDTNTTYVLSYKSQGTLLKLDIDPNDSTIQSIKLFADR